MKKIPRLFELPYIVYRTYHPVVEKVTPGCEWVINGEGVATRKWDGSACMIDRGILYKRYDAKHGKTPPADFIPAQDPDEKTGHWPGWIPVQDNKPEDKYHLKAWEAFSKGLLQDGTYELVGPKINGNPDGFAYHMLIPHGKYVLNSAPRTYEGLKEYFKYVDFIEGIVWHHEDGRMCKIRRRDFYE